MLSVDAAVDLERMSAAGVDEPARALDLLQRAGMKLWPPKPGFTLMIGTRSTLSISHSSASSDDDGLNTSPALHPARADELQRPVDVGPASG